jgi:hypothetical protein
MENTISTLLIRTNDKTLVVEKVPLTEDFRSLLNFLEEQDILEWETLNLAETYNFTFFK